VALCRLHIGDEENGQICGEFIGEGQDASEGKMMSLKTVPYVLNLAPKFLILLNKTAFRVRCFQPLSHLSGTSPLPMFAALL